MARIDDLVTQVSAPAKREMSTAPGVLVVKGDGYWAVAMLGLYQIRYGSVERFSAVGTPMPLRIRFGEGSTITDRTGL